MKKALIINTSRLGDIVMSIPIILGLKEKGYRVELLHLPSFGSIVPFIPSLDDHIVFPFNAIMPNVLNYQTHSGLAFHLIKKVVDELAERSYDIVFNTSIGPFVAFLTHLSGGKHPLGISVDNSGRRQVFGEWSVYHLQTWLNRPYNRFHWVDINRWTVGISQRYPMKLNISEEAVARAHQLLPPPNRWIGLMPSASLPEKRMPSGFWIEVLKNISQMPHIGLVMFGSEDEREQTEPLIQTFPQIKNFVGKTDLELLTALIGRCQLFLTHDTGPMHLAVANKVPVLVINTGSAYPFETAPYQEGSIVISSDIACFPCSPGEKCGHYLCQDRISVHLVTGWIRSLLAQEPPPPYEPGTCVYRTTIGQWGESVLTPLGQPPLKWENLIAEVLREVWLATVEPAPNTKKDPLHPANVATFLETLTSNYTIDPYGWEEKMMRLEEGALQAIRLMEKGKKRAHSILRYASTHGSERQLALLGEEVHTIDRELIILAHKYPDLHPLISFLTFSKETLNGSSVKALAQQTALIYQKVRHQLGFFMGLMKWVSEELGFHPPPITLSEKPKELLWRAIPR